MANNQRLSPSGPNLALLANGKPPRFEVLDPLTVRYSWDEPNPGFLPAIAASQPLYITSRSTIRATPIRLPSTRP